jgi:hypothetical protein
MRSRPRGSVSTRFRKPPDQHKPSLRSRKDNPGARGTPGHPARQPGHRHTPAPKSWPQTGPAGPQRHPSTRMKGQGSGPGRYRRSFVSAGRVSGGRYPRPRTFAWPGDRDCHMSPGRAAPRWLRTGRSPVSARSGRAETPVSARSSVLKARFQRVAEFTDWRITEHLEHPCALGYRRLLLSAHPAGTSPDQHGVLPDAAAVRC